MWEAPLHIVVVSGTGISFTPLNAFDCALMDAGIANYNHIKVSSILPAGALLMNINDVIMPIEGSLLPGVISECRGKKGETVIAILAMAHNKDVSKPGLFYELTCKNVDIEDAKLGAARMLQEAMLARAWEPQSIIVKSAHLTITDKFGCAVVMAVLLP